MTFAAQQWTEAHWVSVVVPVKEVGDGHDHLIVAIAIYVSDAGGGQEVGVHPHPLLPHRGSAGFVVTLILPQLPPVVPLPPCSHQTSACAPRKLQGRASGERGEGGGVYVHVCLSAWECISWWRSRELASIVETHAMQKRMVPSSTN